MPRKIPPDITFDDAEDETLFTRAGVRADPDAADLVAQTDGWLSMIDAARAKDRAAREAVMNTDAARIIANTRLDLACVAFGDDLYLATGKDTKGVRWTQFFPIAVSRFIKQRLADQAAKVRNWLGSKEPTLKKHRDELDAWSAASLTAIEKTHGVALVRGQATIAREQMAEDLTRERDGLHDALSARARERGLPRDWPDQFFRTKSRPSAAKAAADGADPAPPSPATPGNGG
jgi:hypothetical protein